MDFIKYPPERLYRRFTPRPILYHSSAFDVIENYINIVPFYQYIDGADPNRLQNLLNYISSAWEKAKSLQSSKGFQKSTYRTIMIPRIHTPLSHQEWDDRICDFINHDDCIALFVVKCIMSYVFPD
tara:strand:+ start:1083 stop:1460 length:378 start_codon:yes stop_codon:yes gene_type:complete